MPSNKFTKTLTVVAVVGALAGGLTACGGSDHKNDNKVKAADRMTGAELRDFLSSVGNLSTSEATEKEATRVNAEGKKDATGPFLLRALGAKASDGSYGAYCLGSVDKGVSVELSNYATASFLLDTFTNKNCDGGADTSLKVAYDDKASKFTVKAVAGDKKVTDEYATALESYFNQPVALATPSPTKK